MKTKRWILFAAIGLAAAAAAAQTVETVDGARVVHNKKGGLWQKAPKIKLTPVFKLGDIETDDEHYVFANPTAAVADEAGTIYVLDSQIGRIQKYDKQGKYLASLGRKGQGPGEFGAPGSLHFDAEGRLILQDMMKRKIIRLTTDGQYVDEFDFNAPILPLKKGGFLAGQPGIAMRVSVGSSSASQEGTFGKNILRFLDPSLKTRLEFVDTVRKEDDMSTQAYNQVRFAEAGEDRVVVAFTAQNRIESYDFEGRLVWRADRDLNYKLGPGSRPGGGVSSGGRMISLPSFVACTSGLAVDAKGRAWVLTFNRQIRDEEMLRISASPGQAPKREGNFEARTTDLYKLEIFDPDGILLGEIPMTTFIDKICIYGDLLFLIDSRRGACVHVFKIEDVV